MTTALLVQNGTETIVLILKHALETVQSMEFLLKIGTIHMEQDKQIMESR